MKLRLFLLAAVLLFTLSGCNIFARYEVPEETTDPAPVTEEPEVEAEPEVVIDSPIVGTWHNTYTSDGSTSTLTFLADGTGYETDQADAPAGSRVAFTYYVREDYVELTVGDTTLQYTYVLSGDNIEMTYQGYSTTDE